MTKYIFCQRSLTGLKLGEIRRAAEKIIESSQRRSETEKVNKETELEDEIRHKDSKAAKEASGKPEDTEWERVEDQDDCGVQENLERDPTKETEKEAPDTSLNLFQCKVCNRMFKYGKRLVLHMKKEHEGTSDNSGTANQCHLCQKTFKKKRYLHYHMKRIHQRPVIICNFCPLTTTTQNAMERHVKMNHTQCACRKCQKVFPSRNECRKHENGNHRVRNVPVGGYVCVRCKRVYLSDSGLARHIKIHKKIDIIEGATEQVEVESVVEREAGECEAGEREAGEREAGEREAGEREASEREAGEREAGEREAGEREAGEREAGEREAGERQAGERQAGDIESDHNMFQSELQVVVVDQSDQAYQYFIEDSELSLNSALFDQNVFFG